MNKRFLSLALAVLLGGSVTMQSFPQGALRANAATVDYPAQYAKISIADGSRNINISGYADNALLNTWTSNGEQNENWRFDYVSSGVFRLVNQGTGRLLSAENNNVSAGADCVIYGNDDDTAQYWYVTAVAQDGNGDDLYYKITNYENSNLALTYQSASNTITLETYSGADNQKFLLNTAGLQGFGGYAKDMNGQAKASTIGGLLGETVFVSDYSSLVSYATSDVPLTIVITSDISCPNSYSLDSNGRYRCDNAGIYMKPDKTIIGSYGANGMYNVYFRTYEGNYGQGHNIILRNIEISHDKELNNDNIWEFSYGWNFWIDHCTFVGHSSVNGASTGLDDWDKFLNFKGTTDFVTISDCKFGLHEYGVLLGYPTDTQETYDTYNGAPCVTLADNYYNNCITRAPALMRYGYFHSVNNYVINFDMGYTIYTACKLYSENNYFDGGTGKGSVVNDGTSTTDVSYLYPGVYTDSGSTLVNSNYSLVANNAGACSWRPSTNYTYSAKNAADAKSYCTAYSGAQSARSNMHYASFASVSMPAADYITEADIAPEPISGNLIQNLTLASAASYNDWAINDSLAVGDAVFSDRDVVYTTVPAMLLGAEAVMTSCDAKAATGTVATFTAGADITVYVALDVRVKTVPTWLSGWTDTGLVLVNNSDVNFRAYGKAYQAGDTVTLGENGQTQTCVNYVVLAKKTVGDVDADGDVDIDDVEMLRQYLVCNGTLTDPAAAELSGDGCITAVDLTLLKQILLTAQNAPAVTTATTVSTTTTTTTTTTTAQNSYELSGFQFSGKVFLVGDSTVCEYDSNTTSTLDRYGWGMKLGEQFNGVTVRNLALSGRSSRSFLTETNYTTLCNEIGAGDYLFIQFGHNDEKTDESTYPGLGTYTGLDWSTLDSNGMNSSGQYSYEWILAAKYITMAQNKGALPILVTPITRRGSDGTANYAGHVAYQEAMIGIAAMYNIPVIDMTTQTTELYTELYSSGGADATAAMHCISSSGSIDNTHLSGLGASTIAGMIADNCVDLGLSIGACRKS